jgi:hypothetical protein
MVERVRSRGIPTAESIVSDDEATIVAWADAGKRWPIVVKPVASAGSDGVAFCDDTAEARAAFRQIHGQPNQLGGLNRSVMAQERLYGQQYFVNTVSRNGRHYVSEIWKDVRLAVAERAGVRPGGAVSGGRGARGPRPYALQARRAASCTAPPTQDDADRRRPRIDRGGAQWVRCCRQGRRHRASHVTLTVDCYTDPERFDPPRHPVPVHRQLQRCR